MKENESKNGRRLAVLCLAGLTALGTAGCGNGVSGNSNVIVSEEKEEIVINFFSPMEKTDPDVENVARTASDLTIIMAEEKLGEPCLTLQSRGSQGFRGLCSNEIEKYLLVGWLQRNGG